MIAPWVSFPAYLVGQDGYIASPTWLAAVDADPTKAAQPVGTGPFMFESYQQGGSFKAKRNPNYWNKPYPYLDQVEFRVIVDALTRQKALESHDVDVIHTTNAQSIVDFRKDASQFPMEEVTKFGETSYTMINVGDPDVAAGRPARPVRPGLRPGRPALIDKVQLGVNKQANGPFSPDQAGALARHRLPDGAGHGQGQGPHLAVQGRAPRAAQASSWAPRQDQTNLTIAQAQQEWFKEAGVDEVTINQIEQGKFIDDALNGAFQTNQWRNHSGINLDNQFVWWYSAYGLPLGQSSPNFGRINDKVIDQALLDNRTNPDPAAQKTDAEAINKQFGSQCYNLWDWYTVWGIPHEANVQGIDDFKLPDGSKALLGGPPGAINVNSVWISK